MICIQENIFERLIEMSKKEKRGTFCLILGMFLIGLVFLNILKYPAMEVEFYSTNEREALVVFYNNGEKSIFDENHIKLYGITSTDNLQKAVFKLPAIGLDYLRMDFGSSAGRTEIKSITFKKNLFLKKTLQGEEISQAFPTANMLTNYKVEKNVVLEYEENDPYIQSGNLRELSYDINFGYMILTGLTALLVSFLGSAAISFLAFRITFDGVCRMWENIRKSRKARWICVFLGLFIVTVVITVNSSQSFLVYWIQHPSIEISFKTDNYQEPLEVFYNNGIESVYDDKHYEKRKVYGTNDFQTVIMPISKEGLQNVRIDFGGSARKIEIASVTIRKSLFEQKVLSGSELMENFDQTNCVKKYKLGEYVEIECEAGDPYISSNSLKFLEYDGRGAMGILNMVKWLGFCLAITAVVTLFIYEILHHVVSIKYFFLNKLLDMRVRYITKAVLLLMTVLIFVSVPLYFTVDSAWYLSYLKYFEGKEVFAKWNLIRGWLFPYLIYITSQLFGLTSQGLVCLMLLFFILTLCLCFSFFKIVGDQQLRYIKYAVIIILFFNPVVFGYYHTLLTEFLGASICLFNMVFFLKAYYAPDGGKARWIVLKAFVLALNLILAYSLKQTYIAFITIPFVVTEFCRWIKREKKGRALITFCVAFVCLLASNRMWTNYVHTGNIFREGKMVSATGGNIGQMFNNSLANGATYFEVVDENTVAVLDNNMEVEETFEFSIKKNGNIRYIIECFLKRPDKMLMGYINNYLVLTNYYGRGEDYKSAVKEASFTRGNENSWIACAFSWYRRGKEFYTDQGYDDLMEEFEYEDLTQFKIPVDSSIVLEMIYHFTGYVQFTKILFTISLIAAPLLAILLFAYVLWHVIKKRSIDKRLEIAFILEITVFGNVFALAILNNQIDRYCFPVFMIAVLGLFLVLHVTLQKSFDKMKCIGKR